MTQVTLVGRGSYRVPKDTCKLIAERSTAWQTLTPVVQRIGDASSQLCIWVDP